MESMDVMAVAQTMETFERQVEELGVQTEVVGSVLDVNTAPPVDEVDELIRQEADAHSVGLASIMSLRAYVAAARPRRPSSQAP